MRQLIASVLFILLCVTFCFATDFNGRWEGTVKGQNGEDFPLVFNFKVEGEKLTGTIETPMGEQPIKDGKVKGEEIWFTVEFGDSKITHEGKMAGDAINVKSHGPWGDGEFTLKHPAKK
jgi:hypothetical protein